MSRVSKNILYNLFGQGLLLILGFVAVKYIFRQLGEDALGIIYFTTMLNALLSAVFGMGVSTTVVREVSAHLESEPTYIHDLLQTFSCFFWGIYVVVAVAFFLLAPVLVDKWINLKSMSEPTAVYVVRFLGISALLAFPRSFYTSLFNGLQRMEIYNLIDVITIALQQFGTILILILRGNLFHVVYWFAFCYIIRIIVYFIVSSRFFSLNSLFPIFSFSVIKRTFGFASKMMSISVLSTIHVNFAKLIISKLMPIGMIGYYSTAYGAISRATLLTGAIARAAFPSFSELFQAGDRQRMLSQYHKLQDLLCFGVVPIFAAVPFASLPLFSYMFNVQTARLLLLPVLFLCVGFYMNGTLNVPYVFSLAVGKPGIAAWQNFYALFVVLPVTGALIYLLGLTGAALAWVFYHIFAYSYGVPRMCKECMEIPIWRWYLHVLKILLLAGLTYGVAWVALSLIGNYSILALAIAYIGGSVAFLTGAYFMIGEELRGTILGHFHSLKTKLVEVT